MSLLLSDANLRKKMRKIALLNAVSHGGKARQGPVIGKLLSEMPQYKSHIKNLNVSVAEIIEEVNNLNTEKQKEILEENWPEALIRKKTQETKKLPPLPNVDKYKTVITRFSPNPDAPIHLGSTRAIVLCCEYAKIYKGRFLVRFEDTDPKLKRPQLKFYDLIKEDLKWLNCEPDKYFTQSDRLPVYYDHAEKLLKKGNAYICVCEPNVFKKLTLEKKPCPCRSQPTLDVLSCWKKMLDGTYKEGEAVVRVKTELGHSNPAVRDWPALRIIDTNLHPHPRVGNKYRVWPLYNFAAGIDDHLMGVTHIIRGKEHLTNQTRQEFMYRYFNWAYPETIHYGRIKVAGASLSKSKMVQEMHEGKFRRWDDPRLATIAALRRRGIRPNGIKRLIFDVGPKTQDVTISWENLYAHNRKIIESMANRYFFVRQPKKMVVNNVPKPFVTKIALHPSYPKRGFRQFNVNPKNGVAEFWIETKDAEKMEKGACTRLMELFNVTVDSLEGNFLKATFHSENLKEAKRTEAPLIHWIPYKPNIKCTVVLPDATVAHGLIEENAHVLKTDSIVQFMRFGFARIESNKTKLITAIYSHR